LLTGVTKDTNSGRGAPHINKKQLAPFNEVYGVRRQDYGNCDFTRSSIKHRFSNLASAALQRLVFWAELY